MEKSNFDWVLFYKELSEKLLEYKDKRHELIEFIFAGNGLSEFANYLHLQDRSQKINDIDPFSFMGIFNRGKLFLILGLIFVVEIGVMFVNIDKVL